MPQLTSVVAHSILDLQQPKHTAKYIVDLRKVGPDHDFPSPLFTPPIPKSCFFF